MNQDPPKCPCLTEPPCVGSTAQGSEHEAATLAVDSSKPVDSSSRCLHVSRAHPGVYVEYVGIWYAKLISKGSSHCVPQFPGRLVQCVPGDRKLVRNGIRDIEQ